MNMVKVHVLYVLLVFYCPEEATAEPLVCPAGSYCPKNSTNPIGCPKGYFSREPNLIEESQCQICEAGYYCPIVGGNDTYDTCDQGYYCNEGSDTATPTNNIDGNICPAGHYCPTGTGTPIKCPSGTYNPSDSATQLSDCLQCQSTQYCNGTGLIVPSGPCSAGYFCIGGAETPTPVDGVTGDLCPVGYYCEEGVANGTECEIGTFVNSEGNEACDPCSAGFYCPGSNDRLTCTIGNYCPEGSSAPVPCPAGQLGLNIQFDSILNCTDCPAGEYCENNGQSETAGDCAAGYYCENGSINQFGATIYNGETNTPCITGHYCPIKTAEPKNCPLGTFSSSTGNEEEADCQACLAGNYCGDTGLSNVTGPCNAGYYCLTGSSIPNPTDGIVGNICSKGTYCIEGSDDETLCPAGSYNPDTGANSCIDCPAGYYCEEGEIDFSGNDCPAGYYCPINTTTATEFACEMGTFSNVTNLQSIDDCTPCPGGYYCDSPGSTSPNGVCDAGYYCPIGSKNATSIICPMGYYCPEQSTSPTPCDEGYYCGVDGMSALTDDDKCSEGYFCNSTEISATSNDCPVGYYCVRGTHTPVACPLGTYNRNLNGVNVSSCIACDEGYYCDELALDSPYMECDEGYYCPSGSITPGVAPSAICSEGTYCPTGSASENNCPAGSYQPDTQSNSCLDCPAGYYCNGDGNTDYTICPAGSYCPTNTTSATSFLCPAGTYSNTQGLEKESDCTPCDAGFYCAGTGKTAKTGPCVEGYYCILGASVSNPTDGVTGNICPVNNYCPEQSILPTSCPLGFSTTFEGQTDEDSCVACPAGQYCASTGSGITYCDGGYICTGGAIIPNPNDDITGYICPEGHYCPSGALSEIQCNNGTYNPDVGQDECYECIERYYCPDHGMTNYTDCPMGYYCPSGSNEPLPCPAGTFSQNTNLKSADECTACTVGKYCNGFNLTEVSGDVSAGYFCEFGCATALPDETDAGTILMSSRGLSPNNGPCPAGYYCDLGTTNPSPCPIGTFSSNTGLTNSTECVPCTAGSYCSTSGLDAVTGPCKAGYYCPTGSSSNVENICPVGYHCPSGSSEPQLCDPGSYSLENGLSSCNPCPAGYYCNGNTTNPIPCPIGTYCEVSSDYPTLCHNGTYGVGITLTSADDCAACPSGHYCTDGNVTGTCSAGYLCVTGNDNPTPGDGETYPWPIENGGICPPGFYCEEGTKEKVACQEGTSRLEVGGTSQDDCGPCAAGYICDSNVPRDCIPGWYCPANTTMIACPIGTYQPDSNAKNDTSCLPCPEGYYCKFENMTDYTYSPCPVSYYCPEGTTIPLACPGGTYNDDTGAGKLSECDDCAGGFYCSEGEIPVACKGGTYCPAGSSEPIACEGGKYCPPQSLESISCDAGYYCPTNSSSPTWCDEGYYCPFESTIPSLCPAGYAVNPNSVNRTSIEDSCVICPAGTFGADITRALCEPCTAGYVCLGGTTSSTPENIDTEHGYICPVGHYCPTANLTLATSDYLEIPCPKGYYLPYTGATDISECILCDESSYSSDIGQEYCKPCGSSSISNNDRTTCNCIGLFRGYQPSDGSCLCNPGYEYYDSNNNLYFGDSRNDCQIKVLKECGSGMIRGSDGLCKAMDNDDCANICSNSTTSLGTGLYDPELGICVCDSIPLDSLCDDDCRNNAASITANKDGSFTVYDPASDTMQQVNEIPGVMGDISCDSTSGCDIVSIVCNEEGQTGIFGVSPYINGLLDTSLSPSTGSTPVLASKYRNKYAGGYKDIGFGKYYQYKDDVEAYADSLTGYINPTICIKEGSAVLFEIDTADNYPVYAKDNLLNTNDEFDYGEFRKLEDAINNNASDVSIFSFRFNDAGTYVFESASDSSKTTIISVLPTSQSCGTSSILSTSPESLTLASVTSRSGIALEPDASIVLLLVATFWIVSFVIGIFARLKQSRALKAEIHGNNDTEGAKELFKKIYLELKSQGKLYADMFSGQTNDFDVQISKLMAETAQIKALIAIKLTDGKGFAEAAGTLFTSETTAREMYEYRQGKREVDIVEDITNFLNLLNEEINNVKEDNSNLLNSSQMILDNIDNLFDQHQLESIRREQLLDNAAIIGEDIIEILNTNQEAELEAEAEFMNNLESYKEFANEFNDNIKKIDLQLRKKLKGKEYNAMGKDVAKDQHATVCIDYFKTFQEYITNLLKELTNQRQKIIEARDGNKVYQTDAEETLEERSEAVLNRSQQNLFRGIDDNLTEAIKFFLGYQYQKLNPDPSISVNNDTNKQFNNQSNQLLNKIISDDEDEFDLIAPSIETNATKEQDLRHQAAIEETELKEIVSSVINISEVELKRRLDDFYAKCKQMDRMLADERDQQEQELFVSFQAKLAKRARDLTTEEQALFNDAKALVKDLNNEQQKEEEELMDEIRTKEQAALVEILNELRNIEKDIDLEKQAKDEEMQELLKSANSIEQQQNIRNEYQVIFNQIDNKLIEARKNAQVNMMDTHNKIKEEKEKKSKNEKKHTESREDARIKVKKLIKNIDLTGTVEGINLKDIKSAVTNVVKDKLSTKNLAYSKYHHQVLSELQKQQDEVNKLKEQLDNEAAQRLRQFETEIEEAKVEKIAIEKSNILNNLADSNLTKQELELKSTELINDFDKALQYENSKSRALLEKSIIAKKIS